MLTVEPARGTLDVAALEMAQIEHPGLDPAPWLRELDHLALEIAERAGDLSDARRFLSVANHYLFDELGFHGNQTYYYDPRNSCLNDVLAYRTGIPITLSLVYMEVARRLAKPLFGIGAPGHFLVEYEDGDLSLYLNPFHKGRVLTRDQCEEMVREYAGAPVENALARSTPKQILVRMLRNLEGAYIRLNDFDRALTVSDLLRVAGEGARGTPPNAN